MEIILISSTVVIALGIILILFAATYNVFQDFIIRINEAEACIDSILRKRFDLLNKSINIIRANIETKEEVLESIVKLRSRKLSNFDLDRQLYDAINEFYGYKEKYPELLEQESFIKIDVSLSETEIEISSARKYYNDVITDYNKKIKTFPSNIVAKISKLKYRPYFDGKDMTDDVINDFKL